MKWLLKNTLEHISAARAVAVQSNPEEVFMLALDLYQVTGNHRGDD